VEDSRELSIETDEDVVRVRQAVRALAVAAMLSLVDQTKLVTAASELARNTLIHGKGGTATLHLAVDGRRSGVRAIFTDDGPGTGLGLGLSGARRLVDSFTLDTEVGKGTTVEIVKWAR
jgi:serine/threonine-protein kinase RsbT